jgi:hypothetical protein
MELLEIILAGFCTLGIYTFLYKENSIYRIFEHAFIGIAAAWGFISISRDFLWSRVFKSMFGYSTMVLPDGTVLEPYHNSQLWYLIPAVFGLLYYTMFFEKYRHLAQLVISFTLGCSGGLAFKGFFVEFLPQLYDCFRPLYVANADSSFDVISSFSNVFFIITFVSAYSYFFFTFKISEGVIVSKINSTGRYLMMGCFGAYFGSTMMARMALLVERLDFLMMKWIPALLKLVTFSSFGGS